MHINFTLFGQMITFALLVYLTMKYIWPPITQAMHERTKKIAEGLAAAEQGEKSLEEARAEVDLLLQEAKTKVASMLEQAQKRGVLLIEEAKETAKQEAKHIIQHAEQEALQKMNHARRDLKAEVGRLALNIAERVIEQKMDAAANAHLINDVLEKM